jgi:glycine/D-amino acid oxidase-like deaminating enzyme
MPRATAADVIIIGAGVSGIAAAYYLAGRRAGRKIVLVDALSPMSFTSAQSGENYRNWWPNRTMADFIDHSIDLLEQLSRDSDAPIRLSRRGYALATRERDIDDLMQGLHAAYGSDRTASIRIRDGRSVESYPATLQEPHTGVDVLTDTNLIGRVFPAFDPAVRHVLHIRRAGDFDSHQLGQVLLTSFRASGGSVLRGEVAGIGKQDRFEVTLTDRRVVTAGQVVVAAGPFVNKLLAHLGERLPVRNVLQQKLAFEDVLQTVPRNQPFAVDLDELEIDWTAEERELLGADPQYGFLAGTLPGNAHRRPDGTEHRRWLRLGWAYNNTPAEPDWSPTLDDHFPEIALRAAARLNPALKAYYGALPAARSHYGGYYTMTDENLPLIGPLATDGAFVIAALSGFGTMAACAAGECCAQWIDGMPRPDYARRLSLQRYDDKAFMREVALSNDRGVL